MERLFCESNSPEGQQLALAVSPFSPTTPIHPARIEGRNDRVNDPRDAPLRDGPKRESKLQLTALLLSNHLKLKIHAWFKIDFRIPNDDVAGKPEIF